MGIRRYGKPFFLTTTFLLGGLHAGRIVETDDSFRVRQVVVRGNEYLKTETIMETANVVLDESTFETDVAAIQQRVETLSFVANAHVARIFPSTVEITVRERQPVALLNCQGLWPVDRYGNVLPRIETVQHPDLPIITGFKSEVEIAGKTLPISIRNLTAFIAELSRQQSELYHQISEFRLQDGDLIINLLEGGVPVILGEQNWSEKCSRLQAIFRHVQLNFSEVGVIDLRFDNQIVTREGVT